jgi:hypothetical protein
MPPRRVVALKTVKQEKKEVREEHNVKELAVPELHANNAHAPSLVAALLIFVLYVWTLPPTVVGGDSGEIVVAAWKLVYAHPPGYPLITLVGHIFCHYVLPLGEPAWRMGVLNSMFGAATAALLVQLLEQLTGCVWSALTATFIYALSELVWQYATTPEVFAMNNMFSALILNLLVSFALSPSNEARIKYSRWGVVACSLALSNQHTISLLIMPVALYVTFSLRHHLAQHPAELLLWIAAFIAGMSPYILLAALSSQWSDELYSWGDTSSASGLLTHFLRQEYGTFDLISGFARSSEGLIKGLSTYLITTSEQSLHLAFPSVLLTLVFSLLLGKGGGGGGRQRTSGEMKLGVQRGREQEDAGGAGGGGVTGQGGGGRGRREVLWLVISSWVWYVSFFHWRMNLPLDHPIYRGVLKRFYMQPNILLAVLIADALATVLRGCGCGGGGGAGRRGGDKRLGLLLCVVCAWLQIWLSVEERMLQRRNTAIKAYALALIEGLPQGSLLLTKGDLTIYPTRYVQARYVVKCMHACPLSPSARPTTLAPAHLRTHPLLSGVCVSHQDSMLLTVRDRTLHVRRMREKCAARLFRCSTHLFR